jgi:hypothetical protein
MGTDEKDAGGKLPYSAPAIRQLTADEVIARLVAELGPDVAIAVLLAEIERRNGKPAL